MKTIKSIINAFVKSQFSKKVVIIITALFILTFITDILITFLTDKEIHTILDYAQNAFFFCFGGYALKAIPENVMKIKTSKIVEQVDNEVSVG
jgi:hypothetical protein